MKRRYCPIHDSLQSPDWPGHCHVRYLSSVTDECELETMLMAEYTKAKYMQKILDAYIEPIVRKPPK
jgi:hypothetical protein